MVVNRQFQPFLYGNQAILTETLTLDNGLAGASCVEVFANSKLSPKLLVKVVPICAEQGTCLAMIRMILYAEEKEQYGT
jgi:hypothetical protein